MADGSCLSRADNRRWVLPALTRGPGFRMVTVTGKGAGGSACRFGDDRAGATGRAAIPMRGDCWPSGRSARTVSDLPDERRNGERGCTGCVSANRCLHRRPSWHLISIRRNPNPRNIARARPTVNRAAGATPDCGTIMQPPAVRPAGEGRVGSVGGRGRSVNS